MVAMKDIAGQRFGRLLVVERVANTEEGRTRWRCKCDCGGETLQPGKVLRKGLVVSCGCYHREVVKRMGQATFKHGHAVRETPEYRSLRGAIGRCHNPRSTAFAHYGGRGIIVADEWRKDFSLFLEHVGPRPAPGYTLDRIDNDGNYEPGNVRWATKTEQSNNQRSNHMVVVGGQTMTLAEAIARSGTVMHPRAVRERVRLGWTIERALYDGHKRKRVDKTS